MGLIGSCHCKATVFEVSEVPQTVTRCTCSLCSKRGALWAYYAPSQFSLKTDHAALATYRWKSMSVAHHFCPVCGCGTFTETPDWSKGEADFENMRFGVNARLFDDFDLDRVEVVTIDGKTLW